MRYLPIHLDVHALPCLIVGGGEVAARKLDLLVRAGAAVRLVAPALCPALTSREDFEYLGETFREAHLADCRLVISATDDAATNTAVARACQQRQIPVNVVDEPALCSFIVPALVDRSPLIISISTGGSAPVLATRLRSRIESLVPASHAGLASFMGAQRGAVKAVLSTGRARRRFWQRFLDSGIPELLGTDAAAATAAFKALLGTTPDAAPGDRVSCLELTSPDPADLTLRGVALLADADQLVFAPDIPEAIRRYARRDATVVESHQATTGGGHTVHVRLLASSSPTTPLPAQEATHE